MPGRVDLWPVIEKSAKTPEPDNWYDPVDLITEEHHAAKLGQKVAETIRHTHCQAARKSRSKAARKPAPCMRAIS